MTYMILILGALGLVLTAGSVLGLVLEVARNKHGRWQLLAVFGVAYVLAFTTEPPAAWAALWKQDGASLGVAVRSLCLGGFMALLTREYINKCRGPQ